MFTYIAMPIRLSGRLVNASKLVAALANRSAKHSHWKSTLAYSTCCIQTSLDWRSNRSYQHIQTIRFSSPGAQSPYDLLNVPRNATAKEIKLAYFREAKKWHPDMNPNDPKAKEKFQTIAAAYELLSDEKRRKVYDATGRTHEATYAGQQGQGNSNYYDNYDPASGAKHAEDVFNSVKEDMDVVKEAFLLYTEEVKDEISAAVECAKTGDWNGLLDIAKDHKVLIMGIVLPTVVFLRYPPAVFVVLRVMWAMGNVALVGLLRSGNLALAARMLWKGIVKLSNEQKERLKHRKRKYNIVLDVLEFLFAITFCSKH